jgi:hypothetical protein
LISGERKPTLRTAPYTFSQSIHPYLAISIFSTVAYQYAQTLQDNHLSGKANFVLLLNRMNNNRSSQTIEGELLHYLTEVKLLRELSFWNAKRPRR